MRVVEIKSKNDMAFLACKIADASRVGDVFALKGTLGVGKSFFAREFIRHLSDGVSNVLSPTFNLVYSYNTKKGEVFHFDLYRLKNAQELENIGFFDALKNGICLIEWPEIAQEFLPKNHIEIEIKLDEGDAEEVRIISILNLIQNTELISSNFR